MIKKYVRALKISKVAFKGHYVQLVFWIVLRGLALCLGPLLIPISMQKLFNAMEIGDPNIILRTIGFVVCVVIPVYLLNFLIYLYSDVWVLKMVFKWQHKCLYDLKNAQHQKLIEGYSDGIISQNILNGSWAGVQAWTHFFRLIAPLCTAAIFLIVLCFISYNLIPFIAVAVMIDLIICKIEVKFRGKFQKHIMKLSGSREEQLENIINNIQYLMVSGLYSIQYKEYTLLRKQYDKLKFRETLFNASKSTISEMLEKLYYVGNSIVLYPHRISGMISAGDISSTNVIFNNFRTQIIDAKSQLETTINKYVPILELNMMFENCETQKQINHHESEDILKLEKVSFKNKDTFIIHNISFSVFKGEKIALVGKNGSGKSTLLKCILGLYSIDQGHISTNMDLDKYYELLSYVPAKDLLFENLSAKNNILLGANKTAEEIDTSVEQYYDAFMIGNWIDISNCSGGEKQRINIARACIKESPILLLDEPTSALNYDLSIEIMKRILKGNKTVIYATHAPDIALLADKIMVLDNGEIKFFGNSQSVDGCIEYREWLGKGD